MDAGAGALSERATPPSRSAQGGSWIASGFEVAGDDLAGDIVELAVAGVLTYQVERDGHVDVPPGRDDAPGLLDHHAAVQRGLELSGQLLGRGQSTQPRSSPAP